MKHHFFCICFSLYSRIESLENTCYDLQQSLNEAEHEKEIQRHKRSRSVQSEDRKLDENLDWVDHKEVFTKIKYTYESMKQIN